MVERPDVSSITQEQLRSLEEAERDRLAAGVPLVCCDERHEAKVRGLEARIASALAVVDRFDEYLLRAHAVADLRDALNGNSQSATTSSQIRSWADHAGRACPDGEPCPAHDSPASAVCCVCGSGAVAYVNYRQQSFCWPCANGAPFPQEAERDAD